MEETLLLTYLFPTQPSPLQSSINNVSANGYLNVVVSGQGQTVYAQQIQVYLPIGDGAGCLSASTPIATCNSSRWSIGTAQLMAFEALPMDLQLEATSFVMFNCLPQTAADQLLNFDLQFSFQITGVDSIPGPYTVGISEIASTTEGGGGNPQFASYNLTKAAATFYLDNFTASATGGDVNVPFGVVPRNTSFTLSWESNGNQFSLFTSKDAAPIYTGSNTQYTLSAGISSDTTYILQAQIVGGPGAGGTSPGFEIISLYDSLTVACSNPDLRPNSINNATTIVSTGTITSQNDLNVTNKATVGSLQVNGASTLAGTTVNSTLNVTGQSTLAGASATGLTVNGTSTLNGPVVAQASTVQMLAAPNVIMRVSTKTSQTFVAPTDGTVVGYCINPTDYNKLCVYWMFIVVAPVSSPGTPYQVGAQGGNNYAGNYGTGTYVSQPATLNLPVRKGDTITCYCTPFDKNQVGTTVTFYFFGEGASPGSSFPTTFLPSSSAVQMDGKPPYNN